MLAERVEQLRLEFVFAHARAARGHRATVRERGNLPGAAHDRKLVRVLHETHVVEQRQQIVNGRGRQHAAAALCAHRVEPAAHLAVQFRRRAECIVQRGLVGDHARQLRVDFVEGECRVEAERFACAFGTVAETFPRLALDVFRAAEQDRRGFAGSRARVEHEQRLGFGEARQVVEVAVVTVRIVGVAVAQHFRRGRDDGDAAALRAQRGEDALAAPAVDVDGRHDGGRKGGREFGRLVHRAIVALNAKRSRPARPHASTGS